MNDVTYFLSVSNRVTSLVKVPPSRQTGSLPTTAAISPLTTDCFHLSPACNRADQSVTLQLLHDRFLCPAFLPSFLLLISFTSSKKRFVLVNYYLLLLPLLTAQNVIYKVLSSRYLY